MKMRLPLLLLSFALLFLLSACSGGFTTTSWPGVTVDGETAYLAYGQHVYAVNLTTGAEIWRFPKEANPQTTFYAAPVLTPSGQVIVGSYNKILYSLDPVTGLATWEFTEAQNRFVGSPLVNEKGIFAPSTDGKLYALSFTKQALWASPFTAKGALWAQPASDPSCECIFQIGMDHHLYAIDADTGQLKWADPIDLGAASASAPTFGDDGMLYIGTFGNEMLAIDVETGAIAHRFATQGWVWSAPALANGRLYFGDLSGAFYVLEAANLAEVKRMSTGSAIIGTPLVTDSAIYFASESGVLHAVDFDGDALPDVPVNGNLYASPVMDGDVILLAPIKDGQVTLVAVETSGAQRQLFTPSK